MRTRIAVPDNPIFAKLTASANEVAKEHDLDILKLPESQVAEMVYNNKADAALVTPLIYGAGVREGDFRMIPGPVMFAEGYTELVSMCFNSDLSTIDSFTVPSKDDYMMIIARILLAERYQILADLKESNANIGEELKDFDAAFTYGRPKNFRCMDLTEDWTDQYNISLPIAFWICRNEEEPLNIREIINKMTVDNPEPEVHIYEKAEKERDYATRNGKIYYNWKKFLEDDLDQTLELLFQHDLTPELASLKIAESA